MPVELIEDYVSAQTYARALAGDSRFGFAWAPRNLAGITASDFAAADRHAARAARRGDRRLSGGARGRLRRRVVPRRPRRRSLHRRLEHVRGLEGVPARVHLARPDTRRRRDLGTDHGRAADGDRDPLHRRPSGRVDVSSSSPTGEFAASPGGPWTATLEAPIASGASTTSFYLRDAQAGTPTITVAATGKTGATQAVTIAAPPDMTPPETTLDAGPTGTVASSSATFAFSASEPGSRFECSLDGTSFAACTSPATDSGLADGAHTFAVRAIDTARNADPTPATANWTVAAPAVPPASVPGAAAPAAGAGAPAAAAATPTPLPVSPTPAPTPPPVIPAASTADPTPAVRPLNLVISRPKPVLLRAAKPTLKLTARLNRAATLSFTLLDRKGRVIAHWSKRVAAGTVKLALPLPVHARRPGRDTLRITASSAAPVKVVPAVLR